MNEIKKNSIFRFSFQYDDTIEYDYSEEKTRVLICFNWFNYTRFLCLFVLL